MTTSTNDEEIRHEGTNSTLRIERVTKIVMEGDGCYVLFGKQHYRDRIGKVYSGIIHSVEIPQIGSAEFYPDCQGTYEDNGRVVARSSAFFTNVTRIIPSGNHTFGSNKGIIRRYVFGGGSLLAAVYMIAVLTLSLKNEHKSQLKLDREHQKDKKHYSESENQKLEEFSDHAKVPKEQERHSTDAEGNVDEAPDKIAQNRTSIGVNYRVLWDEVLCWKERFSWAGATTAIVLGLFPSSLDVFTDYEQAKSWDDDGFNPQVRALVYFFICFPHLVTILKTVNSWTTALFHFPLACKSLKFLGKSVGIVLYLAILAGVTYGALFLGSHHPDAFFYISLPSAAITIGVKLFGVFVQGPEAKRALTLLTAR